MPEIFERIGPDGKPIRVEARSPQEAEAAFARITGGSSSIVSRAGAPASIGARNPGFFESFGEQAGDITSSLLDLPGAALEAGKVLANPYEPKKALGFLKEAGTGLVDAVKNRAGLLGEGRVAEFAGRTAADAAAAIVPGIAGKFIKPAKSVAGGSAILQKAEALGIEPKRRWFGLRDDLVADPLEQAPGNHETILKRSIEDTNVEFGKVGVAPVSDIQSLGQLQKEVGSRAKDVRAARVKSLLDESKGKVAGVVGDTVDPATAGDDVLFRVKAGQKAASNVLGPAVSEAKKPFLDQPMPADELARVAGKYGQEFPGVTDATGKLLFDEGAGLKYGAVDDIKRKLGYVGSDKNRAASALSRDLQDTSLKVLEDRGLDVSKIRKANADYASQLGKRGMYTKGRPGQMLKTAIDSGNTSQALNIPLTEGRAWEQVVKSLDDPVLYGGGDAAVEGGVRAKEMLRRSVVHNNMGLNEGLPVFRKNWQGASPRMKAAVFSPQEVKAVDSILSTFDSSLSAAKTGPITKDMAILQEVWSQYSPTRNLVNSPFTPTSEVGLARLLGAAMARNSTKALRTGLYQATRLGRPAMLYNLVAKQTRLERKHPIEEEVPSFAKFLEEKQQ